MNSQQAINLLNGLEQRLDDYCKLNNEGKAAFRMAITALELFGNAEQLPSAQPEPIKINIDDFNKEDLERFKKELGNTPITVLPAQPEIIRCKDCKYWKDSDGVYRRGFDAESKCPLNLKKVYEGTFYCGMAERRTDE